MNLDSERNDAFNKANQLYNSKLYKEALGLYQKAIELDLTFYDAHFCIAKTLVRLQQSTEGIAHFKKYAGLIPSEKLQDYVLGFLNILQQENNPQASLEFLESFKMGFNQELNKKYLELLLISNKKDSFYKAVFSSVNEANQIQTLKQVLQLETIPQNIKTEIIQDNIFEKIELLNKKIDSLSQHTFSRQDLLHINKSLKAKLDNIKSGNTTNYNNDFQEIVDDIKVAVSNVYKIHPEYENDTLVLNKIIKLLKSHGFDKHKINEIELKLANQQKTQRSKNIKRVLIFVGVLLFAAILFVAIYYIVEKKDLYHKAIKGNEIYLLNNYLNKYGDNDAIHEKRELLRYKEAVKYNTSKTIDYFIKLYPKSKFLREVKIHSSSQNSFEIYGVETPAVYLKIAKKDSKTFLLPYGCTIGIKGAKSKVKDNKKYFKVSKNITLVNNNAEENVMLQTDKIYYVNATLLNLRKSGNDTAPIVNQIPRGEPIMYLGRKSDAMSKAELFGEKIWDHYYYVKTINNELGWLHGAGLNNLKQNYNLSLVDFTLDIENIKTNFDDSSGIIIDKIEAKQEIKSDTSTTKQDAIERTIILQQEIESTKSATIKETPAKPDLKPQKTSCKKCLGAGRLNQNCSDANCNSGFVSTTCTSCYGNYRSGSDLCENPGCNYEGCEYCDYDAAACGKCTRGKTSIKHNACNGTGKISTQCNTCSGKGFIIK